jgi:hypothetical protein
MLQPSSCGGFRRFGLERPSFELHVIGEPLQVKTPGGSAQFDDLPNFFKFQTIGAPLACHAPCMLSSRLSNRFGRERPKDTGGRLPPPSASA